MINSGTPDTDLQSLSLHHDDVCKAAASWTHPKRVGGHLGAARCGRQRLPSHIGLPSGTRHTVDRPPGNTELAGKIFDILLSAGDHDLHDLFPTFRCGHDSLPSFLLIVVV